MNKSNPKQTETTQENKPKLLKSLQVFTTLVLILALAAAVFLPYSRIFASPEDANAVTADPLTKEKTFDTDNFVTDPIDDDTIDYTPEEDYLGTDSFQYEICDSTGDCAVATVRIDVTIPVPPPVTQLMPFSQKLPLSAQNIAANTPTANDDSLKVEVNTAARPTFANINVLGNDDFGDDGPGTERIRLGEDCGLPGPDLGDCTGPFKGIVELSDGPRSPDPAGITFIPPGDGPDPDPPAPLTSGNLLISDSEMDENPFHDTDGVDHLGAVDYTGFNLFETDLSGALQTPASDWVHHPYTITTYGDPPIKNTPFSFSDEPSGVAYNPLNKKLYFADDNSNKIFELDPGPDGEFNTSDDDVREFDMAAIGSLDASGVTIDTSPRGGTNVYGHVIVVDAGFKLGGDGEVYDIDLGDDKLDPDDTWTHFDVFSLGVMSPEGIEFNPDNCSLFILSSKTFKVGDEEQLVETTLDGRFLRYLDTSDLDNAKKPSGLAYGPASSGSPGKKHLYITARGTDNNSDPYANDGKVYEASFELNAPPAVDAGLDQTVFFPNDATLDGTVIDGCDDPPAGVTTTWTVKHKELGTTVTFADPNAVDTTASFSHTGEYTLELEANDGSLISTDEVVITVTLPFNTPPEVDAGPDQTITLPDSADLDGTVIDDGLPAPPPGLTTMWSVVGTPPGTVTFGDHNAVDTTASFSAPGIYELQLTANDGELSASDTVQIAVKGMATLKVWLPIVLNND
jgi:hypothetical protein